MIFKFKFVGAWHTSIINLRQVQDVVHCSSCQFVEGGRTVCVCGVIEGDVSALIEQMRAVYDKGNRNIQQSIGNFLGRG